MFFSKTPSKSKCLQYLRRVYPGAELVPLKGGGMQLTYLRRGEAVPVLEVVPKETTKGKDTLAFAVLRAAFRQLGYAAEYKPGFPSGKFVFEQVKDFQGPEKNLPIELDPEEPTQSGTDLLVTDPATSSQS